MAPQCNGIMDTLSLHAGACVAGGERTLRHTAVRDVLCRWAERAGLQPEKERPGLLLPQRPEDASHQQRRPADIFLPSYNGAPAALDLAITAPQRQDIVARAATTALTAATSYAATKASHLDTANLCAAQGVRFVPLVAESTGAWEPEASKLLLHLSRSARPGLKARATSCTARSFKNSAWWSAATVHERCSAAVLNFQSYCY